MLSLALQGGIPIHILQQGLNSSLADYFRKTMAQAWARWPLDVAGVTEIAELAQGCLIQTLRNPMIVEQAAEAIHNLCVLRQKLPADIPQPVVIEWLDANAPGWRASIPLHLPQDRAALDALFCDILTEPPARVPSSARIVRVLTRVGEGWHPGILLPDDAELPRGTFKLDGIGEGRFGLTLTGEAARALPSVVGQMYWRPGRGAVDAMLTCELGHAARRKVNGIAADTPVTMRLTRSDIEPRTEIWPGGEAIRSEVIVYEEVAGGEAVLTGRGSVRSTAESLLVLTLKAASVTPVEGDASRIGDFADAALWRVRGIATVETSDGRYRVACSEEAVERVMTLPEAWFPGLRLDDRRLTVMVEGRRPVRSHEDGRIVLQGAGTKRTTGRLTWAWLDVEGFSIDRQRALVLPKQFEISASEGDSRGILVRWAGLRGWKVRVDSGRAQDGTEGAALTSAGRVSRVHVVLVDPAGRETGCTVDVEVREPHLSDRAGKRASLSEQITLAEMSDWMLRLPRRETVDLTLRGVGGKPIIIGVEQEGNVPLHELYETVQWMIALAGFQDAWIDLAINGRLLCRLALPRLILEESGPFVTAPLGLDLDRPDLQAVIRPFDDGAREYVLWQVRQGVWHAPEVGRRPGIAYLRTVGGTLTRPRFMAGQGVARDAFSEAMEIADSAQREQAISTLLESAPEDAALLLRLRSMVVSLRGLSPLSLDALRLLGRHRDTLATLLISASALEREEIIGLERHLPFLWMNIPKRCWHRAIDREFALTLAALKTAGIDDTLPLAAQAMKAKLDELSNVAPWFPAIRWLLGNGPEPEGDLGDLACTHIRTHSERKNGPMHLSGVVQRAGVSLPPALAALSWQDHPTLLAPVVLALRLLHDVEMSYDERWQLRHALLFDRTYVAEAYGQCVLTYGRDRARRNIRSRDKIA